MVNIIPVSEPDYMYPEDLEPPVTDGDSYRALFLQNTDKRGIGCLGWVLCFTVVLIVALAIIGAITTIVWLAK